MGRNILMVVMIVLCFEMSGASSERICLPIGHPELSKLKIHSEIKPEKDLWLGKVKFPAGCMVNTAYGPEFSGDMTEIERNKFRIFSSVECESGIVLGGELYSYVNFDGAFCVDDIAVLAKSAKICGVKLEKDAMVPFSDGVPNCKAMTSQKTQ